MHEISQTNGIASFADSRVDASGRVDAWHKLGTPVGHAMTAEEALNAAHLANWNVRKVPLWADLRGDEFYSGEGSAAVSVPGKFATVFNNPVTRKITPIGVVGTKYAPIENEALTEFANAIVDESGAHFETAGSLRDYSQTFITMKLPKTMVLEGVDGTKDVSEWYLSLFNSHDGNSAMFGLTTQVRVVCANTANMAIRGAHSKFSVQHTSGWKNALQIAREKLGLSFEYQEAFEAEVRKLYAESFTDADMKLFTEELVSLAKAEKDSLTATRRQNEANAIYKLWVSSPSIKGTPVAGTKFGAFNAVTEYVDHYAGVRGGGDDQDAQAAARATRTLTLAAGSNTGLKSDAWALLRN